jgi:predicted nucleic acid-binding protein
VIFLDTNIMVDILEQPESAEGRWSTNTLAAAAGDQPLVANLIVAAELAGYASAPETLNASFAEAEIELIDLTFDVAIRAGAAFREYRRRGGPRHAILPDFLIAAHADVLGATLMTRDRRLASYFPDLTLITPETDHG